MCRFASYVGDPISIASLVTEPANSLIHQSIQSKEQEEPLNGDGFGLAWYVPSVSPEPALFKDISPAWNNLNLIYLAKVTQSPCILAHVRAATPGIPVVQLNCHPFAWRRFAFMHNGRLAGFQALRRELLASLSDKSFHLIRGSTDSEHLFALCAEHILSQGTQGDPIQLLLGALESTVRRAEELREKHRIKEPSFLNMVLTDGENIAACRYISNHDGREKPHTLYYWTGGKYVCSKGVGHIREKGRGAVIISSEPLTDETGWKAAPPNSLLVVSDRCKVETVELRSTLSEVSPGR